LPARNQTLGKLSRREYWLTCVINCRNFSLTQLNNSRSKNSCLTKVLRIFVIHIMDCKNNHKRSRRISFSRRFSKPTISNTKRKLLKVKVLIRDHKRSIRISKPTTKAITIIPSCECLNHGKVLTSNQVDFKILILFRIACKTKRASGTQKVK